MENSSIAMLLSAFILIIIGASLIGVIASEGQDKTVLEEVSNEVHALITSADGEYTINETAVYTVTNAPSGAWKPAECPITSIVISNGSESALTLTTDYVIVSASAGTYTLVNNSDTIGSLITSPAGANNNSYIDYKYCGDEYLVASWNRTIINLVPGFFAIALLGIGIGLLYGVMKKEGILNI